MTEKRFTLEMQYWKGNPQGRKLFDNLTGQEGMSLEELCNIASDLHSKCEELESVLEVYEDSLDKLEDENRQLKLTYAKCRDCKHADLYNPEFAYPYLDPQCKLNVKKIHSDSNACEDFEMIGRNSR